MKKNFNFLLKLILLVTIFSIFVANKVMEKSLAIEEQNVVLGITPKPKIDIVLSKAKTEVDLTTFKDDVKTQLTSLGIDTNDIEISAIETVYDQVGSEDIDVDVIINNWNNIGAPTWSSVNGQIYSNVPGGSSSYDDNAGVKWTSSNSLSWWGTGLIDPNGYDTKQITMDFTMVTGGELNEGVCFNVTVNEDGSLNGYFVTICSHHASQCRLWRFDHYTLDQSFSSGINRNMWCHAESHSAKRDNNSWIVGHTSTFANDSFTCLASWDTGSSNIPYHIECANGKIVIKVNGNTVADVTDKTYTKGTYGFWGNNCEVAAYMYLTDIHISTVKENIKHFEEVLRESTWRQGAYKFLVNVDDNENKELQENSVNSELVTRLINEGIYFIAWGQEENRNQFSDLVEANNGNGKFINNTDYDTSINETASYIESIVENQTLTQTVIVDEPISLSVNPPGIDNNTIDSEWPYGKWKIEHDYTYYENNIGQFAESGKYINNLITTFDKTGRYVIKYKDQSIYPQEIFVHRRPIAQIGMQISGSSITLNSQSYDKDKFSENKGIKEEEWKWKDSSSNVWNNGKLTTMDTDKTYIVQLRVKDFQNTWSIPAAKYITKDTRALPVAMYDIPNDNITKYEEVEINNISYDPVGREIISSLWEVYKDGNKIYSGTTPKINYLHEGVGTYTMYLTVTNSDNIISEKYGRTFKIVEDTMAPEVVATPVTANWAKRTTVHLKFTDKGGSLVRGYKYAITDSQAIPTTWSAEITKSEDDIVINTEGRKYLHIIAYDNANNVSNDRILGPYLIDNSGPTIQVEGDFNTVTTQGVICNIRAIDLLSGLKTVSVNNETLTDLGNSAIKINKNGTYVIKAEDNIGNISTKEFIINNVYNRCEAGLEHPTYSSSYKECPICKLIENLQITKDHEIYNAQPKQVTYHNPQGATIVEYYNGNTQKPIQVGTYSCELKVVYEGIEYNTGITGEFSIRKKEITIENIEPQNKSYDGTNQIALTGGNLVGIEESDQVEFLLPTFGITSSKDIGQYHVTIPEIVLTGEKAKNYQLMQPTEKTIQATISPRQITITQLQAKARPYNGKTEVEITAGKLNHLLENNVDDIGFKLKGGIARSSLVGEQIVDINTIELTNNTKGNYYLIAPDPITVQITKKEITIENIQAENRPYDGTQIVAIQGGNLRGIETGDDVAFILPQTGMISEKNMGEYDVTISEITLTGEKATNYQLLHPNPEAVKVSILPRQVTISELHANTRPYNRNTEVEITEGKLNNLLQDNIDNIGFKLNGGIARSDLVGEQVVDVNKIELTNNTTGNYELIPPEPISVQITPKKITIENIQAENRPYDGSDIVTIQGGNLIGIETGDEVGFHLPQTGIISDKNIGEYHVTIPEIILTGERASNYQLIHPAREAVKVTIFERELTIHALQGKDRKYDKTDIVEIEGGKLQNIVGEEEVIALIPKTGVIPDCDIGTWPVEIDTIAIEGRDSTNYVLIQPQPEDILVEILEPSQPNLQLVTFIHKINDKELENKPVDATMLETNRKENKIEKRQQEEIRFADQIEITIRVYNTGEGNGYAQKITNIIPKGMKFVAEDETNQKNEWKQINRNTVETEKLNFMCGVENEIEKVSKEQVDYRDISLVLEVVADKEIGTIENQTTIEQVDIREKTIDYDFTQKETILPITISYTDFIIKNTIQEMIEINKDKEIKYQVSQGNQQFSKIEMDTKEVDATQLKIIYQISITNQGNAKAKVDQVVSSLPTGLQFSLQDNPEWKKGIEDLLICEGFGEIGANETKTKKLVLYGDALSMIGNQRNDVIVFSSEDIDQRKIEKKNQENLTISNVNQEIFKTNNVSKAELIFSIRTGIKVSHWFWFILIGFIIIGGIVVSFVIIRRQQLQEKIYK